MSPAGIKDKTWSFKAMNIKSFPAALRGNTRNYQGDFCGCPFFALVHVFLELLSYFPVAKDLRFVRSFFLLALIAS